MSTVWRRPADCVVLHEPNPIAGTALFLRTNAARFVVWHHSDLLRPWWALPTYGRIQRRLYERADCVIVSNPVLAAGSMLKQQVTASPVTTVTADNLDSRGVSTVQDAIQMLASNNGPALINSFTANGAFAAGASAVSLRCSGRCALRPEKTSPRLLRQPIAAQNASPAQTTLPIVAVQSSSYTGLKCSQ